MMRPRTRATSRSMPFTAAGRRPPSAAPMLRSMRPVHSASSSGQAGTLLPSHCALPHQHASSPRQLEHTATLLAASFPGSMRVRMRRSASHSAGAPRAAATAGAATGAEVMKGKTAAVVGGGPAGLLAAAQLARLGAKVKVFERLSPQDQIIPPSVWAICLGKIAADAIVGAGLNPDFGVQWRAVGSSSQMAGSPPKFVGPWVGEDAAEASSQYSTQPRIVQHLRDEIDLVYGADRVTVENQRKVVGGDVCSGQLITEHGTGQRAEHEFDLVVAADGVSSLLRALMADSVRRYSLCAAVLTAYCGTC
eukprot:jgi/Ulvmu1/11452/UM076_0027.1